MTNKLSEADIKKVLEMSRKDLPKPPTNRGELLLKEAYAKLNALKNKLKDQPE